MENRASCMSKKNVAYPIEVSNVKELFTDHGYYLGLNYVVVTVSGNCVPKIYSGMESLELPRLCKDKIFSVKYVQENNTSVIEYRFHNTLFRNRGDIAEKFRKKMLDLIIKQECKKIKQKYENTK